MEDMAKKIKNRTRKSFDKYVPFFLLLIGILFIYNIFTLFETQQAVTDAIAAIEESAIPLDVTLTVITYPNCDDCYDLTDVMDALASVNINIVAQNELQSTYEDAKALIEEYAIEKIPAIILTGQLNEKEAVARELKTIFEKISETTMLFQPETPVYVNAASGEIVGRVQITSLTTSDCEQCQDLSTMITALKQVLIITDIHDVAYGSAEADSLIAQYGLEFAPTIILSSDAEAYIGFAESWSNYGTVEDDGSFVLRQSVPPYIDTTSMEVVGLVDIIYLVDESCVDCYDVNIHKTILQGFGMVFDEERIIDISSEEGQALIAQYNITKVPTVILTSDAENYSVFEQVWMQVGTIAEDGSYIFTNMDQLQGAVYTDLADQED
ncbi:hypothetical protein COV16_06950 [Candidatus Woesearchaeota archaeon CG10_big_fil_rev_8_21_14_0_10_34_8]|nr:MAG: hypothetical protein COV16_06950 [Candidatus Woesearchaeota archaeon CG10_big_fil_rev_8_21_14_0_10_34_8]